MTTMPFTPIATAAWILIAFLGFPALSLAETVRLYFDPATPQIAFAAGDIKAALEKRKHTVQTHALAALTKAGPARSSSSHSPQTKRSLHCCQIKAANPRPIWAHKPTRSAPQPSLT